MRGRQVGVTPALERGIELAKPEPGKVGFHGLHHDAHIWPVLRWTGPSGRDRQETFADLGQAALKNGFGRGRGWGTRHSVICGYTQPESVGRNRLSVTDFVTNCVTVGDRC